MSNRTPVTPLASMNDRGTGIRRRLNGTAELESVCYCVSTGSDKREDGGTQHESYGEETGHRQIRKNAKTIQ